MKRVWKTCRKPILGVLVLASMVGPAMAQHELTGELPKPGARGPAIVLVAGATGRTGREILEQLKQDPRFAIRPMARDVEAARRTVGTEYAWVAGDVTRPESLVSALRGVTLVLCAIGATERSGPNSAEFVDFGGVRNLSDAARDAGVRQFVLESSMGAGSGGGFIGMVLNLLSGDVLEWKAKGEAHLRASGVPYTIVRAGGLVDGKPGQAGIVLEQGDKGSGRIARADVAAVMIATLDNPDALRKTFEVFNDDDVAADQWRQGFSALVPDPR
ncbi:MAG: SDR family oxidoreductase [Gammaproteobacteria bacterium]